MQQVISTRKPSSVCVTLYSLLLNFFLVLGKFFCGILAASPALISDAIHSAADLCSTLIVLCGILLGICHKQRRDLFESISSILLSLILSVTALEIGKSGILSIHSGSYHSLTPPGTAALVMITVSVLLKLVFFFYMKRVAQRLESTALRADAYHHLTDAIASLGAFVGIAASRYGYPIFDPIASVFVACFILAAACGILRDALCRIRYRR